MCNTNRQAEGNVAEMITSTDNTEPLGRLATADPWGPELKGIDRASAQSPADRNARRLWHTVPGELRERRRD
ncbi:hypothetical protein SKAU_G00318810 [Synaphobranchus kaupii]|uniref:Uncharacterized protein n=1 Tax=Synaphobranchus kaupii TaxID=118154 RepID=A0A9Q1ET86_SYNKA|nr:hypothetical protein SKAU_G00318810 [Synaphobranchus kaupii]